MSNNNSCIYIHILLCCYVMLCYVIMLFFKNNMIVPVTETPNCSLLIPYYTDYKKRLKY